MYLLFMLMSCEKDNKQPTQTTCDCYERHEYLSSNLGQFTWALDYETNPSTDFCSNDNGVWNYNSNSTKRWRTICQ